MKNEHLEPLVVGEEHWTRNGDVDLFVVFHCSVLIWDP